MPRLRIAWLMAAIALVAIDLGAIRGLFEFRDMFSKLVGVGVLPMANLLALGAVLGGGLASLDARRQRRRLESIRHVLLTPVRG